MCKLILAGCVLALATPAYAQQDDPSGVPPPAPYVDRITPYFQQQEQQQRMDDQQQQIDQQQQQIDQQQRQMDDDPMYGR